MEKPWKVILAFLGVFVAGAVFGGFFALRVENSERHEPAAPIAQVPAPAQVKGQPQAARPILALPQPLQAANLMKRFAERLDLTTEQRDRVMPLIQRATQDFRRQQQAYFREDGIILQRLQEDLAKELTPDQRDKLEKMQLRQKELQKKQREQFMERMKGAGQSNKAPTDSTDGKAPDSKAPPATPEAAPAPTSAPAPGPETPPVKPGADGR